MNGHPLAGVNVQVCVPSRDQVDTLFCMSLATMMQQESLALGLQGAQALQLNVSIGALVERQRCTLVERALKFRATHLLWLDTDMTFPPDTVARLLRHNQAFVAANCVTRAPPHRPTAVKHGAWCYTGPGSTGLEAVESVGLAVALIRREVFERIPAPHFTVEYDAASDGWTSEDATFCRRVREAGFEILIDHDLSKAVGHRGACVYGHEHAQAPESAATGDIAAMMGGNRAARRQWARAHGGMT